MLFVDLDGFKVVNDLFGHHVGDELLCQMADRLANTRRQSDTVARFGGDEFVVVCPDIKTSAVACRIADHLLDELAVPAEIGGVEHRLTASVGIAVTSPGSAHESPETLLRNADTAMYRAKEEGRAGWELFDDSMRDRVLERFEVERGPARRDGVGGPDRRVPAPHRPRHGRGGGGRGPVALVPRRVRHHPPGVVPGSGGGVGAHRAHGALGPRQVVVATWPSWRAQGRVPERFRLWVNLSPHQLANPHFADLVRETLDSHGIPPALVGFEVVEDALRDVGATIKMLQALREQGLSINLDDFGAGHSNLSWLQELAHHRDSRSTGASWPPCDAGAATPQHGHRARGSSAWATPSGCRWWVKGSRPRPRRDALRSMDCELAQGYFFGYPGSAAQLWALASEDQAEVSG